MLPHMSESETYLQAASAKAQHSLPTLWPASHLVRLMCYPIVAGWL